MRKIVSILFCLIFLSVSSYAAQDYKNTVLSMKNEIAKEKELQKGYEIYTRAHYWRYDSKTKHYIIPEDINNFCVNVIFEKDGRVIKFSDKVIKYKDGRFSQIGNEYVTYLNGKIYKIGKDKVELDSSGYYVEKIGNKSLQEYFIGTKFTKKDVVDSRQGHPGMIFTVASNGFDFGGIFSDITIPFEGTPISVGHHEEDKKTRIKRIGEYSVEYDITGMIRSIGGMRVEYE